MSKADLNELLKWWLLYKIQSNYYQFHNEIHISKSLDKHPFLKEEKALENMN